MFKAIIFKLILTKSLVFSQAYPPSIADLDTELQSLVGEHSALENYVDAEDNQRAVQLSISVLSAVNNLQDTNNTKVKKLQ